MSFLPKQKLWLKGGYLTGHDNFNWGFGGRGDLAPTCFNDDGDDRDHDHDHDCGGDHHGYEHSPRKD